jgi:hypothetical protein
MESATTWPDRVDFLMRRIDRRHFSLHLNDRRIVWCDRPGVELVMNGFARRQSPVDALAAVDEELDGRSGRDAQCFRRVVIAPARGTRSTRPSENISVWTPRSCFPLSRRSAASGMAPMPTCKCRTVLNQFRDVCANRLLDRRGRPVSCCVQRPGRVGERMETRQRHQRVPVCPRHAIDDFGPTHIGRPARPQARRSTDVPSVQ